MNTSLFLILTLIRLILIIDCAVIPIPSSRNIVFAVGEVYE